jgi:hypothetical protein
VLLKTDLETAAEIAPHLERAFTALDALSASIQTDELDLATRGMLTLEEQERLYSDDET